MTMSITTERRIVFITRRVISISVPYAHIRWLLICFVLVEVVMSSCNTRRANAKTGTNSMGASREIAASSASTRWIG